MLNPLRYALQGAAALLVITFSTIVLTSTMFVLGIFKFLAPGGATRNTISRWLSSLGELWVSVNKLVLGFYRDMEWSIRLPGSLDRNGRYVVFCNHQSWVDILVLQYCLNRRAPFMRFLMKQELIWIPFLGMAWWALDMVFLRRYDKKELLRNPALRGKDLENAGRACEKLKHIPVSMMSFPEGTRFTEAKRELQKSPYKHLLRPRYGGIGQILNSFDDSIEKLIDVTIFYPDGKPTFWQFVSGQVRKISVCAGLHHIDAGLRGQNIREDGAAKNRLKIWLEGIWMEKDQLLAEARKTRPDLISRYEPGDSLGSIAGKT